MKFDFRRTIGQGGSGAGRRSKNESNQAIDATYGVTSSRKPDFNSATPVALPDSCHNATLLGLPLRPETSTKLWPKNLLAYRDKMADGVITNLDDLSQVSGSTPAVVTALKE